MTSVNPKRIWIWLLLEIPRIFFFFLSNEFPLLYLCVRLFIVGVRPLLSLDDVLNTVPMQMLTAKPQKGCSAKALLDII